LAYEQQSEAGLGDDQLHRPGSSQQAWQHAMVAAVPPTSGLGEGVAKLCQAAADPARSGQTTTDRGSS